MTSRPTRRAHRAIRKRTGALRASSVRAGLRRYGPEALEQLRLAVEDGRQILLARELEDGTYWLQPRSAHRGLSPSDRPHVVEWEDWSALLAQSEGVTLGAPVRPGLRVWVSVPKEGFEERFGVSYAPQVIELLKMGRKMAAL